MTDVTQQKSLVREWLLAQETTKEFLEQDVREACGIADQTMGNRSADHIGKQHLAVNELIVDCGVAALQAGHEIGSEAFRKAIDSNITGLSSRDLQNKYRVVRTVANTDLFTKAANGKDSPPRNRGGHAVT